jgi:RND family efflux transporter MFP subunit
MVVAPPGDTYVRVFPGKVEASKSAELSFQVPGLVVSLPVKEGQKVGKGQIIARLRQDEFQARRKAAQGQVDQARAALDALRGGERTEEQIRREAQLRAADAKLANAKTEFDRYARLLPSAAVSRAEYELAETAYHVAQEDRKAALQLVEKGTVARKEDIEAQEAQVRTLEGRLAEANVQLSDSTLRAPYSGMIGRRLIEEGQVVTPNKPAVQFQNVEDIDIIADVPEAAMAAGFRGANIAQMAAEFTNRPGVPFPVRVKEVAQVADPVTQTFPVRFTMKTPRRMTVLPGMTATVAVTYRRSGTAGNRILVPVSAVFKQDTGQQVVWVIGPDDAVRCRSVQMGGVKDGQVEIVAGLRPGERIVVAGAPFLREGMKVRDLDNALGGG